MRKNKTSKKNGKTKSLKGTRGGQVGAPPKKTNWLARPFTMEQLFARNEHQCELSVRNKVNALVETGEVLALMPIKQPGGAVGRPKTRFVLKENFDAATMTLVDGAAKPRKARKVKTTAPVTVATVQPAVDPTPAAPVIADVPTITAPAAPAPAPVIETNVAPVVMTPVAEAPAAPQPVIA